MTKEITTQSAMPVEMIQAAIEKGADLDKLEKLLALQERWEANEARKAYASDMVDVQSNIPIIKKTRYNPQTKSKYADLGDIIDQVKPFYTGGGFSITFYEGVSEKEEHIRICADITHKGGHKESYHYDAPMDGKGIYGKVNMTGTHAKATTVKYGSRYLICMVFNIPTGDDVDGNAPKEQTKDEQENPIRTEVINKAKAVFNGKNADMIAFMKSSGITKNLKEMNDSELSSFLDLLNNMEVAK